jgi:hypothetical protein
VLDFSRVFPPVDRDKTKCPLGAGHLYQLFRPEFLQIYRKDLFPESTEDDSEFLLANDLFSEFILNERRYQKQMERRTKRAKLYLEGPHIEKSIPFLIKFCTVSSENLSKNPKIIFLFVDFFQLISRLDLLEFKFFKLNLPWVIHTQGINLRYMGLVYNGIEALHVASESEEEKKKLANAKQLLLCEVRAFFFFPGGVSKLSTPFYFCFYFGTGIKNKKIGKLLFVARGSGNFFFRLLLDL